MKTQTELSYHFHFYDEKKTWASDKICYTVNDFVGI